MPVNSVVYLLFLAVAVALYWLLSPQFRRVFVLLASLLFYASWGIRFIWVPLIFAVLVYLFGWLIQRDTINQKKWTWLGTACALSLLSFFKYRGFFLVNWNVIRAFFGAHPVSGTAAIAFPLGISFCTFEAIGYLIDVRQGRVKMPSFLDLCLFFLFWPNILSGPIVRARELVPQLGFSARFEPCFVFEGLDRIIWGLVQKNVIANMLGLWVDRGFAPTAAGHFSTMDGWFLAISFGLQIYFDFSGYTNMAIGAARLLGIRLPENFRQPYHAKTPQEFWTRWHMTLSRWIRDYLFFPINAKWQGAPLPLYLSLIGVMTLIGLWHGPGWNYILWGSLHGLYLVFYRIYESWVAKHPDAVDSPFCIQGVRVLTLLGVTVAWVVFRSSTLSRAGSILASMFYRFSSGRAFNPASYLFAAAVLLLCALEPFFLQTLSAIEEHAGENGPSAFRILGRPIAYSIGLLLFLLFDENNTQFIYSQF